MRNLGFFFIGASLIAACSSGGSSSTGGPSSVTSVESSKVVTSLGSSEAEQLCRDFTAYATNLANDATFRRSVCGATAAVAAALKRPPTDQALQEECRKALDECLAKPAKETTSTDTAKSTASCVKGVGEAMCSATVGEYTQCVYDTVEAYRQVVSTTDVCSTLTLSGGTQQTSAPKPQKPASCTALEAKCPKLVD